jgi:hypothetical protein
MAASEWSFKKERHWLSPVRSALISVGGNQTVA